MKVDDFIITPTNSSPDLLSSKTQPMSQPIQKLVRRSSTSSTTQNQNQYKKRRQTLAAVNNEFLTHFTSSSLAMPVLIDTMDSFFQTTQNMEDEIMLPTRLKDMSVDELIFDNSVQPDNWHELYTFIRDIRNQLKCAHPFAEEDDNNNNNHTNNSNEEHRKYSNDDEGIIVSLHDNSLFSSASSIASSDEFEQSSTSSTAASFDTIKDELKYHYYGLFRSLDNLTSMVNRVREKYREESKF